MDGAKSCLRHRRYDEEDEARRVLAIVKQRSKFRFVEVYECKEGGTKHWHIGNPHNRRAKRRRKGRTR